MTITMQSRALGVEGGFEFQARVFGDDRGVFVSPYQEAAFVAATGHRLFPVAQTNHSRSRRGVVRGLHYTVTPPGMAKYVYCARGRTLDIILDIRVGSPTFGRWDSALLDQEDFRAVYLPVGMAHGFIALEDDTVVSYMLSGEYVPENEAALSVLDPALELPLQTDTAPILSERDRVAPTLEEARAAGLLPDYQACLKIDRALRPA
ncbi:dTDP-4-dehydrorhamnose 3,5-epimerase [Streptomyces sp. CcalMP-8W]